MIRNKDGFICVSWYIILTWIALLFDQFEVELLLRSTLTQQNSAVLLYANVHSTMLTNIF